MIYRVVFGKPKSGVTRDHVKDFEKLAKNEWSQMSCVKDIALSINQEDQRNNGYTLSAIIMIEDEENLAQYEEAVKPKLFGGLREIADDVTLLTFKK